MLLEKDLQKLFHQLCHNDVAQVSLGNSEITVRVVDGASKLSLSTAVYSGSDFIPYSVRNCVLQKSTSRSHHIKTALRVDEENYKVSLNYLGSLETLNHRALVDTLKEFSLLADEWRLVLDENDKNDLIHVRVK